MKNDVKFEEELTCCFKIDEEFVSKHEEFDKSHSKVSKICNLMDSF